MSDLNTQQQITLNFFWVTNKRTAPFWFLQLALYTKQSRSHYFTTILANNEVHADKKQNKNQANECVCAFKHMRTKYFSFIYLFLTPHCIENKMNLQSLVSWIPKQINNKAPINWDTDSMIGFPWKGFSSDPFKNSVKVQMHTATSYQHEKS